MEVTEGITEEFVEELHNTYLLSLNDTKDQYAIGFFMNDHLKLPGAYWCITALNLLDKLNGQRKDEMTEFIKSCQNEDGGIGGNVGHDSHITCCLYAVLILAQYNALDAIDTDALAKYVADLQKEDGSFSGDSRFSYTAISLLTLLNKMDLIDVKKARDFILLCNNIDGGYGAIPDAESHAAYTFCCIGALAILGDLDLVDNENLGIWISQRQTLQGGFNGRPEKLPDVCYSWWVMSACYNIEQENLINLESLKKYILHCQDPDMGGIGDRPGNEVDVFHTYFGIAALSLMKEYDLKPICPRFAIPKEVLEEVFPHIK
ncbi:unnamed protein product [Moneuplotes crassus]|uniref:Geranylgeranyl transferase type-2 subunit beta n=1 Tax=Euplotes crassus TaxID=5936 RepID=A0AAD1XP08_EUPCR|nr:unnamed protein product [Moneuplotes crassus]